MTTEQTSHPASLVEAGTAAGTWKLDPAESQVQFTAKTFWGLATVKGSFSEVSGQASVSEDGHIRAELFIDGASVRTNNKKRDRHLQSQDFFNVERHPHLEIVVDDVTFTGPDALTAQGTLNAGGNIISITFQGTVTSSADGDRAQVDAAIDVDRTALGMSWNQLGMVSKTARGTAHLVFARS